MHLSEVPVRTVVAVAAIVAIPLAFAAALAAGHATSAGSDLSIVAAPDVPAAPAAASEAAVASGPQATGACTSAAGLQQCQSAYLRPVGHGWGVPVPSALTGTSTNCNLRYGDDPHRGSQTAGDPDTAILTLQQLQLQLWQPPGRGRHLRQQHACSDQAGADAASHHRRRHLRPADQVSDELTDVLLRYEPVESGLLQPVVRPGQTWAGDTRLDHLPTRAARCRRTR
jgi:hypothetical protein